jgi:hypothetical protein
MLGLMSLAWGSKGGSFGIIGLIIGVIVILTLIAAQQQQGGK